MLSAFTFTVTRVERTRKESESSVALKHHSGSDVLTYSRCTKYIQIRCFFECTCSIKSSIHGKLCSS